MAQCGRRMLGAVVLATAAMAVTAVMAAAAAAATAEPAVAVEAAPAKIALVPGDRADVTVVVENLTDAEVRVASAEVLVPARIAVERKPEPSGALAPGSAARLALGLRAEPGFEHGSVVVLVGVERPAAKGGSRNELLTATVEVEHGTAPQDLVASFVASPKKLGDGHEATARLRVANDTPFTFEQVVVTGIHGNDVSVLEGHGADVESCPASPPPDVLVACIDTLRPGEWRVVSVGIRAAGRVHPGEDNVSVIVTGVPRTAAPATAAPPPVVATATFDLSVFGLDALGPFGVASVFVLPGLMAVVTFVLLSRYAYPRHQSTPDTVDVKDPKTMVFVVPAAVLVYAAAAFLFRVDLTDAISTTYVLLLFLAGLGLGIVCWLGYIALYFSRSGRLQFAKDDGPGKVLERLEHRGGTLEVPEAKVGTRSYRFLGEARDGGVTVCSPIAARYSTADTGLRGDFRRALEAGDVAALRRTVKAGAATLSWLSGTGVAVFPNDKVEQGGTVCLIDVRE